jgi:hypothetical protein
MGLLGYFYGITSERRLAAHSGEIGHLFRGFRPGRSEATPVVMNNVSGWPKSVKF